MQLNSIISNRNFCHKYFWAIVYEWEDVLARELGLEVKRSWLGNWFVCSFYRLLFRSLRNVPVTSRPAICFVMVPGYADENICGKSNVVPVIIDFWLSTEEQFCKFDQRYAGNPAVLMTSREAFEMVKLKCPHVNALHWPLSMPDCDINCSSDRKWDCAVVGRPNPVLQKWLFRYADSHQDFSYVYNDRKVGGALCNYVSSSGECLGDIFKTRQSYMSFLRQVKVGLYSTPSIDDSKVLTNGLNSNGYNQVTPRFLEYLAAGCHVISRYPVNPDTDFFELQAMSPCVRSYEDFEMRMDYARRHGVDCQAYKSYLLKHFTTTRAAELRQLLASVK